MRIADVPEPGEPGAAEVVVRPEAVGLCGSDFHYFLGDIGAVAESRALPARPGPRGGRCHRGGRAGLPPPDSGSASGSRSGRSPPAVTATRAASDGRTSARTSAWSGSTGTARCRSGSGLPAAQVFPVGDQDPAVAALIEPVSIAVRAVVRGRVAAGEKVVVFGAGPIGQALAVAAIDRGASVLLVDPLPSRLERGRRLGAEFLDARRAARTRSLPHGEWAGRDGPEVVFEATGVAAVARTAVELVSPAGRVVVVGLSSHDAPLRVGDLAFKEIDVLGVSCCNADEFAEAVSLVARRRDALAGPRHARVPARASPGCDRLRDRASCRGHEGRRPARLTSGMALF